MIDPDIDYELQDAAFRVIQLSRHAPANPRHKARLREELLRRHQELSAESTQRAAATLWSRLSGLKRLTLVAPPALAAVVAFSMLLVGLQVSGHENARTVEAAPIIRALARTAPTVTAVQSTVHERSITSKGTYRGQRTLGPDQRLYISHHHAYLYDGGKWELLALGQLAEPSTSTTAWLWWAFSELPARLACQACNSFVGERTIRGKRATGILFTVSGGGNAQVAVTAWVDRATGLVLRLERVVTRGKGVIEQDSADYQYVRSK